MNSILNKFENLEDSKIISDFDKEISEKFSKANNPQMY